MGLDMSLKKISRTVYNSISRDNFWLEQHYKSEEIVYWRKKYDIEVWFRENTIIDEECSDEITKEKLESLVDWLEKEKLKEDAVNIKDVIRQTDFANEVVFYKYSN
jgi:hypothetical protein